MIIALAGHVDHGKSALVTALTGVATDRAPEAQARGITIDLQAVALRNGDGNPVAALIDVPGHEDFVRAMVAGASGAAALLLVVAADEGMMPQTREHLLIAERLGIPRGIPVITKTDLVEAEWLDLLAADLAEQLDTSPVAFEAPARVSAHTGDGVAALRERIVALSAAATTSRGDDLFRLPVDKVFSRAGIGTVVTGTAWSGRVRVGDAVRLLPGGEAIRIRSLEVHGHAVDEAFAGHRVAVGIAGLSRDAVHRGDVLVHADAPWQITSAFDAEVTLAASAVRPIVARRRVMVHVGTASVGARVMPRAIIAQGSAGLARLVLDHPIVVRGGDRAVLRSWSPAVTIGGAEVIDPLPPPRATWPADLATRELPRRLAVLVARRRHGLKLSDVPLVLGISISAVDGTVAAAGVAIIGDHLLDPSRRALLESQALAVLRTHHTARPDEPGLSVETLRRGLGGSERVADALVAQLARSGAIVVANGVASLAGFAPGSGVSSESVTRLLDAIRQAGLAAPAAVELKHGLAARDAGAACRAAERQGLIEQVEQGRWVAVEELAGFLDLLAAIGGAGRITLSAVRDRTGLSRKFLIPLLDWADRKGLTRRDGEDRVLTRRPSA